ncbi:hypothetical protein ACIBKY_28585 [Nonomuraea sp. NPDC050394]|uniref:hypothetical protein n=1 Tax=Nonomuraea sp. NPDC050394 TaxID=3364363 RepID=UPI003789ED8E
MNNSKTYTTYLTPWQYGSLVTYRKAEDEDRVIHLLRLGLDLQAIGVGFSVHSLREHEVYLTVPGAGGNRRIMAARSGDEWWFTWGVGAESWVRAFDEDAAWVVLGGIA